MSKRELEVESLVRQLLGALGYTNWEEDPNLQGTPERVARLWVKELSPPIDSDLKTTTFPEKHSHMIMVAGHTVWTHCPHHLERVKMKVSIAYLQGDTHTVIGASKLPRIADFFAKGMVLQESFTDRVADYLTDVLKPKGVGVHVVGQHHCMCSRGVETDSVMVTTALRGIFLEAEVKSEFLNGVHFKPWEV